MNPLVALMLVGAAAVVVTKSAGKSAARTAKKLGHKGSREFDGYWLPDNVSIQRESVGEMSGSYDAPIATMDTATAAIYIFTSIPLVGGWEDASEDWGLLGQVINPAAISNPDIEFVLQQLPPSGVSYMDGGVTGQVGEYAVDIRNVPFYWDRTMGSKNEIDLDLGKLPADLKNSTEAYAYVVQNAISLIIQARSFDWEGNSAWLTPACGALVGRRFWSNMAMEAPTLAQALAIPGNSAMGYADYLYNYGPDGGWGPTEKAMQIARSIIHELSPECVLDDKKWSSGNVKEFYRWISDRIQEDVVGGAPFSPEDNLP